MPVLLAWQENSCISSHSLTSPNAETKRRLLDVASALQPLMNTENVNF